MLQQTTVAAVEPFYQRFILRFPTLQNLARAEEQEVLELWSGLGYYNRARNLLRSAKLLAFGEFPRSYLQLLEYPGFGPYTARAVTSIAFDEPVGVVDGNVIRVLSRVLGLSVEHWTTKGRKLLQDHSDRLAKDGPSSQINQALMDLGSEICTDTSPRCGLCPWVKNCIARQDNTFTKLPLKKPKRALEKWWWQLTIKECGNEILLQKDHDLPFLRKQFAFPGKAKKINQKPSTFDFKHFITHHEIFVSVTRRKVKDKKSISLNDSSRWIKTNMLPQLAPFSILKKSLSLQEMNEKKVNSNSRYDASRVSNAGSANKRAHRSQSAPRAK